MWLVLRRLALPGAWLAAAIFALHPVQVETVAWITELKNTESTFFYLLALLVWMKFAESQFMAILCADVFAVRAGIVRQNHRLHAAGGNAAGALAETRAGQLATLDSGGPVSGRGPGDGVAFHLVGETIWEITCPIQSFLQPGGAPADCHPCRVVLCGQIDLAHQSDLQLSALGHQRRPIPGNISGPWDVPESPCSSGPAVMTLGRGPVAAIIFFVAALSPLLGFIPLFTFFYTFVADHYQYLACLGPIALFAGVATYFSIKWRINPSTKYALIFLLLSVLGTLTWRQAGVYQNLETLWRDTLAKNPACWMAHTNLGRLLTAQGILADAELHYRTAIRLKPDDEDVHYNYGNMLVKAGRLDEAIPQYRQALQLSPADAETWNNLGVVLYQEHRTDQAIACFHEAVRYRPDFPDAHFNLGNALFVEHKLDEAVAEYREALRLAPDSAAIKNRLRALGVPAN